MRSVTTRVLVFLLITIGLITLGLIHDKLSSPVFQKPGTRRMAERLKKIVEDPATFANIPANHDTVAFFEDQIAKAQDLLGQLEWRKQLGNLLLLDGKSEEAVQQFLQIRK